MKSRLHRSTFLLALLSSPAAWSQAAVPPPVSPDQPSEPPRQEPASPPASPSSPPAESTPGAPAASGDTTAPPARADEPPPANASGPAPASPTPPVWQATPPAASPPGSHPYETGAAPPGGESPYIVHVAPEQSPREAGYFGLGVGGGRMQDSVTGFGGIAFSLDAGYSLSRDFSLGIDLDGLIHPMDQGATLAHVGVALLAQAHLFERLRLAVGPGYYRLEHRGPTDDKGDDSTSNGASSLGGEGQIGVEFWQAPGGLTAGVDLRTQVSFPDGKFVATTFGLVGFRWYGLGRRRMSQASNASHSL